MSDEKDLKIQALEINYQNMTEKIDRLTQAIENGFSDIKKQLESLDSKYASKLTEVIVYGLVGLILVAVIGALITLVIK